MNKVIEDKLEEIYLEVMNKPNQVLGIFNNFFGEDKVDMQGFPSLIEFKDIIMKGIGLGQIIPQSSPIYNDSFDFYNYRNFSLASFSDDRLIEILNSVDISTIINTISKVSYLKNGFILVHFPEVRITNEYDRFVDITHLYAKIKILIDGSINGCFSLNRSEYPYIHISSRYMHSHVSSIPFNRFTDFQVPCTGTGPINDTISNLTREFDSDIWELFCLELSKYVEVESIEGTPYHRLESIGATSRMEIPAKFSIINHIPYYRDIVNIKPMVKDFTSYFIKQGKLKFDYRDGSYSIGMSFTDFILTISNEFIDWYNEEFRNKKYTYSLNFLLDKKVINKYVIADNKMYGYEFVNKVEEYKRYIGKKVCTFKGKDVLLNITDIDSIKEDNISIVLDINLALYILSKILKVINYKYGKSKSTDSEGNTVSETIRYI